MAPITARHLVAGQWEDSDGSVSVHPSPVAGRCATHAADATPSQIERALKVAGTAQRDWSATPPALRAHQLSTAARRLEYESEEIAPELTREVGKTLREARSEIENAVKLLKFFAGAALRPEGQQFPTARDRTVAVTACSPRGVVLVISPWNFPVNLTVLKLAPALATGNAVVVKPSPVTGKTVELVVRALAPSFPPGLIALLQGGGAVGGALVDGPEVAAVSFTGSTSVGRAIGCRVAARGIPYLAEMGGKNVLYIDRHANLDAAIDAALAGAFAMAGQKCTATGLLFVHADVADVVNAGIRLRGRDSRFSVGDPFEETTDIGPMISAAAARRVREIVAESVSEGAEPVWFDPPDTGLDAPFSKPVVLFNVSGNARAYNEEVFGPVLSVVPVAGVDDAIIRIQKLGYGLVSSIYTDDLHAALAFSRNAQTGTVLVNQPTTGLDHNVPFVGWGDSGLGTAEQSDAALDFYARSKTTYLSW